MLIQKPIQYLREFFRLEAAGGPGDADLLHHRGRMKVKYGVSHFSSPSCARGELPRNGEGEEK